MISEKFVKMTGSAKFEMVITQTLFELQPYGLTCVVILTSVQLQPYGLTCMVILMWNNWQHFG